MKIKKWSISWKDESYNSMHRDFEGTEEEVQKWVEELEKQPVVDVEYEEDL